MYATVMELLYLGLPAAREVELSPTCIVWQPVAPTN